MIRRRLRPSHFREIGWTHWDPLGLSDTDEACPQGIADEYDTYLMRVAGILINGEGVAAAIDYLTETSEDLSCTRADPAAVERTVHAIRNRLIELGYEEV